MLQKAYNLRGKNPLFLLLVAIAATYIQRVTAASFCHITCDALSCIDELETSCMTCAPYFIGGTPSTCDWDSSLTAVVLSKTTPDFSFSAGTMQTCSIYPYRGNYVDGADFLITGSAISDPHYKVDLIVWALFMDQWSNTEVKFTMADSASVNKIYKNSSVVNQTLCQAGGQTQGFQRLSMTFTHTNRTNPAKFRVQMTENGGDPKFGIGNILLIAYRCHEYCLTCTGPAVTQCLSCIPNYWLWISICYNACPAGYGLTASFFCVLCHDYCQVCYNTNTNCSTCKNTSSLGAQVFAVEDRLQCEVVCPDGYFHFLATKQCLSCPLHCVNLTITSQNINSGQAFEFTYTFDEPMDWTDFIWQDFLFFGSSSPTINFYNDFDIVYTQVGSTQFRILLTLKAGASLAGENLCTVTRPESGSPRNVSTLLNKLGPKVYNAYRCQIQSTQQPTMTLTSVAIQAAETVEFTYNFSAPINFSRFDWNVWNFTNMAKNITAWNLNNDFITNYVPVNSTSFKLTITPKTWTFFSNISFCASVQVESNNGLQFSQIWWKLAPSVYTQTSCSVIYACHPFCLTCHLDPKNCSTCDNTIIVGSNTTASQIYKVQGLNQCQVICPTGYYSHFASRICLSCALHCVNLTITSALLNGGQSLSFTYTFDEAINWAGFNYKNFLNFNCTNTSMSINNDFIYVYTPVDALSFKVSLTPKPKKYLVASTVCTIVKPEAGNPLKFSSDLNKLSPSVYTSFNCLTWSTPQVTMTISNIVTQATESIEWTFTFSHPIDFTGFDFGNFTNRNINITAWSAWDDFNHVYTPVDSTTFKITTTPKTWTYFPNITFCVTIEKESNNSLQFSAQWYKLAPSVYSQSNCAVFYACHPFCLTCDMLPKNCSTCDNAIIIGSNTTASQIYKVQDQDQCVVFCPTGYYSHLATKKCLSCALHCINLTITSALINAGESLQFTYTFDEIMDFAGFDWQSFLYFNCTKASINAATDFTFLYTLVNDMTFKIQLTPKPTKYLVNENLCTVIKPANVNLFKYSLALNKIGPSVYTSFLCPLWSTPQVDLAMSNIVSLPTESIEYTFTFSGPMDFSTFVFTDFVFFRSDDAFLNMGSDFTYTYTMVDSLTFKVLMATTPWVYFGNVSFCAVSKSQASTSFQFSAQWYKLAPAVYDQETCGILYACHPFCTSCQLNPKNCQTCGDTIIVGSNTSASQIYKVQNVDACEVICPSGYFDHLPRKMCLSCDLHCVNMTISNQFLLNGKTLNNTSLKFTYRMTQAFDFLNFDWTSFLGFNCTNSSINPWSDFTIVYANIDSQTFTLTLTPNPGKFLVNENFCTIINEQSMNPYSRSIDQNKFNPLTYGMSSCVIWQTPKVNLSITHNIDSFNKFLQFTFAFTSQMNFTNFLYQDFIDFDQSDPLLIFTRDFTVTYTMIDNWNFKLKIKPNRGVHFVDQLFCAITHLQDSTSLQFSLEWYKLHRSVYGQDDCPIWSLPPVNLTILGQTIANGSYSIYSQFNFTFTSPMNFMNFDYSYFVDFETDNPKLTFQKNFTVLYQQKDEYSFVLILNYKPKTKFLDTNTCFKVKPKSNANLHFSADQTPLGPTVYQQFYCTFWQTPGQLKFFYYKDLQKLNYQMENLLTKKGNQQLVKSGVMSFLMPGAQWTSLALLHKPKVIQNLYEGTRFWGSFVLFNVPPYEQDSNKTKYTFLDSNKQILQRTQQRRLLQNEINYVQEWRFNRTGHSGFFLFDTYIQLILIAVAWLMFFCGKIFEWKNNSNQLSVKVMSRVMVLFHKIHEMVLFYLLLSSLIEYRNLDINTYMHRISMIASFVVLAYYLVYELKVFYDMVGYPKAKIHTQSYVWYLKYYGYFIAYYRFEQYSDQNQLVWRHFLRPYNYHTLTFVKKVLMLSAVPIFYDHLMYPVIIITFLQGMDLVRFLLTIPYHKMWRNVLYFTLEVILFVFFMSTFVNGSSGRQLFDDDDEVKDISYENIYKVSGWIGMGMCFLYNSLYSLSCFGEFVILFTYKDSLENMMWESRNSYYLELYEYFEKYGSYYSLVKNYTDEIKYNKQRQNIKTYKNWVNRLHDAYPITDLGRSKLIVFKEIVQRGDIMKFDIDQKENQQLKHLLEVKIQSIKLKNFRNPKLYTQNHDKQLTDQVQQTSKLNLRPQRRNQNTRWYRKKQQKPIEQPIPIFQIEFQVAPAIYKSDFKLKNRKQAVRIPQKVKNHIHSQTLNQDYLTQLTKTLMKFYDHGTGITQIKISTYLSINLAKYKDNELIRMNQNQMRQQIVVMHDKQKEKIKLREMMPGFPIDLDLLKKSSYWKLVQDQQDSLPNKAFLNIQKSKVSGSKDIEGSSDSDLSNSHNLKDSYGQTTDQYGVTPKASEYQHFVKPKNQHLTSKLSSSKGSKLTHDDSQNQSARNLKTSVHDSQQIDQSQNKDYSIRNKTLLDYSKSSSKQLHQNKNQRGIRKPRTQAGLQKKREEQKTDIKQERKGVLI